MAEAISAHPLQWPTGWKRVEWDRRREAGFRRGSTASASRRLTITEAVERVVGQLKLMGVDSQDLVISTNVRTRLDGMPRSGEPAPRDPGAAVYWVGRNEKRQVMAIDQYDRVEDNLAAIAATLDAMRAIERHGGATILERAFTGFIALPAPGATRHWTVVLDLPSDAARPLIIARYRALASIHHPDKPGGSHTAMAELNAAQDAALKDCNG